ncbi:hypothetical protein [Amycolatopsis sp. NPDC059021]|uniref:hypothetical protein n=1 Tax=Amycolatopsis sp. NPDC059021 TaxID=3346704 RepID=UPI003672F722
MDGYRLQVDALGKLIGELRTAADDMAGANKQLSAARDLGGLGDPALGKAAREFEDTWEYGIGELGKAAGQVTERLERAKQRYQQVEDLYHKQLEEWSPDEFDEWSTDDGMVGGGYTGGIRGILAGGQ